MRKSFRDAFQGIAVLGALGSLAFGGTVVWCTAMVEPIPNGMLTALVRSLMLAAVGVFALMCEARYELAQ